MRLILAVLLTFTLISCGTPTRKLGQLQLGMTKEQVRSAVGDPHTPRGSVRNKHGQTIEVWEYILNKPRSGQQISKGVAVSVLTFGLASPVLLTPGEAAPFWLYFADGRLAQWGQAGDWRREADRIYEVRFNPSPGLNR